MRTVRVLWCLDGAQLSVTSMVPITTTIARTAWECRRRKEGERRRRGRGGAAAAARGAAVVSASDSLAPLSAPLPTPTAVQSPSPPLSASPSAAAAPSSSSSPPPSPSLAPPPVEVKCGESPAPLSPVFDYTDERSEALTPRHSPTDAAHSFAAAPTTGPLTPTPPPPPHPPPALPPSHVDVERAQTAAACGVGVRVSAAERGRVEVDVEEAMVDDSRTAAQPVGGVVRMVINGREEVIRLDTQRSLQTHQSEPLLPPPSTQPLLFSARGKGRASGKGRAPSSTSTQLTFSSSLTLTQPSPVSSAAPAPRAAVDVSEEGEDEGVKGKVPALFHPRSREVQRRISAQVAASGKRKATVRPVGGAAAVGGLGMGRGKRRAGDESQPLQTAAPAALDGASAAGSERRGGVQGGVASEESQSRFTVCPMCEQSQPIALINHHLDVECRARQGGQQRPAGSAEKRRKLQTTQPPALPAQSDGQPRAPSPSASAQSPPTASTAAQSSTTAAPAWGSSPAPPTASAGPLHMYIPLTSSSTASSPPPPIPTEHPSPRSSPFTAPSPAPPLPSAGDSSVSLSVFSAAVNALSSAPASSRADFLSPQRPRTAVMGSYQSPLRPCASRSTFRMDDGSPSAAVRHAREAPSASPPSDESGKTTSSASASGAGEDTAATASDRIPLMSSFISLSPSPRPPPSAVSAEFDFTSPAPSASSAPSTSGSVASPSSAASTSAVHPLFSLGCVSGAAFAARRKGRLDGLHPSSTAQLHLRYRPQQPRLYASAPASIDAQLSGAPLPLTTSSCSSPLYCWEVQWLDVDVAAPASRSSASTARCSQRFQDPDTGAVTEVHFTCDAAVYQHPTVDFTSPQLLANHTKSSTQSPIHPPTSASRAPSHPPAAVHLCLCCAGVVCAGASICLRLT